MKKRIAVLGGVLLVLLALVVFPAGARPVMQVAATDTSTLANFLLFITSSGGIAMVLSFAQERSKFFSDPATDPRAKMAVTLIICFALPALAFLVLKYAPPSLLTDLDPLFKIAGFGLSSFFGSQVYHGLNKPA